MDIPCWEMIHQTATTNSRNIASLITKGKRGTFTLAVNNIVKLGYMFDCVNSVLSQSITR